MKRITIDLSELCQAMDSDGSQQWFLDLQTGDVVPIFEDFDIFDEEEDPRELIESDPDRFLEIEPISSSQGFSLMEQFATSLEASSIRTKLEHALTMRRPFRCFKDTLTSEPKVREDWFAFQNAEHERLAREFLEREEISFEVS